MKFKKIKLCIFILIIICIGMTIENNKKSLSKVVMGGLYIEEVHEVSNKDVDNGEDSYSLERFFRPSKSNILNDRRENSLYDIYYGKEPSEINLPNKLLKTPEDTIINYFSILREAANLIDENKTGCGSLGDTRAPYPIAYNFLSDSYKEKLTYKEYLDSFKNKLHINLVKLNQVAPDEENPNELKYFVEIEVIEGSKEDKGLFAYYYGYIYLDKEKDGYKIKNMKYSAENYLCAPYHGWAYDAKSFVEIEYGDWCSMIQGKVVVKEDGYEKRVYFTDRDGNEYYVLFYQLTNGVDIKISDHKKGKDGKWQVVYINPEKCLDKNKDKDN